jgi:hypothetical protein
MFGLHNLCTCGRCRKARIQTFMRPLIGGDEAISGHISFCARRQIL